MFQFLFQKYWNKHGWYVILIGSFIILFIIYILFNDKKGSSDINRETFLNYDRFAPVIGMHDRPLNSLNHDNNRYTPTSLHQPSVIHQINSMNNSPTPTIKSNDDENDPYVEEFIPEDTASKGENECRRCIELITKKQFMKIRHPKLKNPVTGSFLELDCYNDDLRLGIEYQGQQHYKYIPHFHKTKAEFQLQKYRDWIKKKLCEEEGIKLIEVPYDIKVKDIHEYLEDEYKKFRF